MTDPASPRNALAAVETFAALGLDERDTLARELETLSLKRGETLVREGEPADALYIVVSGRFAVTVEARAQPVAEIGAGQPVGEIAFLAGGQRTATVTALRDSLVLRLGRAEFDALSERNPGIWRTLTLTLARRVADANVDRDAAARPRPRTIAVVQAGGTPVPRDFLSRLERVFARHARTVALDAARAAALLPAGAAADSAEATRRLNEIEAGCDFVLYIADATLTPWTEKAIRQSDLVLAVGVHAGDAAVNALEARAAEHVAANARRLVLLHPTQDAISGTDRWLAAREIAMHHHVALDRDEDVERLYRFVSGTARGLVTCGGGAFCAAHIGLYKALREAGIAIDAMGGSSGGGAMAAAFAMGTPPEAIDEALDDVFVSGAVMRRYTWPRYSVIDHTFLDAALARHYGGVRIEDLWVPFFAVSTNLSSYGLHRHRTGDLWAAVRATGSIPGLLPPYYTEDGQMLVDGALMDNVPVRVMHELKSGPNIVASFAVPRLELFPVAYRSLPSRRELMRRALNPFGRTRLPAAPGIGSVLMRSLMANRQDFERHLRPEDLLMVLPFPADMGVLDWHRHTELMQATYAWARGEIARLAGAGHPALAGDEPSPGA